MTTIASIQGDGWVVMGSDTQSTIAEYRVLKMGGHKIYDNNGVLIAGCGQGRGLDILHKGWSAPHPGSKMTKLEELDEWMVYQFMKDVRTIFIDSGYDMKDDGDFAQHESAFIVAVNGVAYFIDDDYSVDRDIRGFMSAGSGGDYAAGALAAQGRKIFSSVDAAQRAMRVAIDAAKEFDIYSGGDTEIFVQHG